MQRVLHIYRTYFPDPPGGLQEAIRQIAFSSIPYGIENTVYALSLRPDPMQISFPEAQVVRRKSWAAPASCDLGGPAALSAFSTLAREADVVHYFFPWPFADVLRVLTHPDKPEVMTYISDVVRQKWLGKCYAPLMWKTLKAMKFIVANCPTYARTSTVLSHPALRDKVRIIPLGIEESAYPKASDDSVFERFGIERDAPYFLFLGVLRYYKGLDFLIRAAKEVNACIVIAGSGSEEMHLKRLARELDARNIVFTGQVSNQEKVSLLRHCLALALPSHLRSEAYGMVLVEAAMFGRPMISCEIGTGTSFINAHEETGLVVEPENPAALARAMNAFLHESGLATRFGKAARQRYERIFSGAALGKAYAELYKEAAGLA